MPQTKQIFSSQSQAMTRTQQSCHTLPIEAKVSGSDLFSSDCRTSKTIHPSRPETPSKSTSFHNHAQESG